jgi:DNA-binding phage protein
LSVVDRAHREPAFAKEMLNEAGTALLNGEPEVARMILRDLVNATLGFEALAAILGKPSKSLHRMLSPRGNPNLDNLAAVFGALAKLLKVGLEARAVKRVA